MRDTVLAIFLTQVPIALGIFWAMLELRTLRKDLAAILRKLAEKEKNE